jgi:hypothetical protein
VLNHFSNSLRVTLSVVREEAFDPTSQHFAEVAGLVVWGKIMMKPYWSAAASIAAMPVKLNMALALPPQ